MTILQPAIPTISEPRLTQRIARSLVHARLQNLRHGQLTIHELWNDTPVVLGTDDAAPVAIRVLDPAFYTALLKRGSIGAAETYTAGEWTCNELTDLVRLLVRDREVLDGLDSGLAKLSRPLLWLFHERRKNSPSGSRRNIAAHYDLGNDFFEQFLDETLTYSSGLFEHPTASLFEAQVAKLDRLCNKLALTPRDHLLEIGTGWGSMAIHAARHYGCRVTTTTISKEQHDLAVERAERAGLSDRITVLLEDYRDLTGRYDKLVSIEMIEAVGHQFVDSYLRKCSSLLEPDGVMAIQAITIQDQHYARAVREVDFIKRYIFPGSFIPSVTRIVDGTTRATDLRLSHLEDMGTHYARTLHAWHENLLRNRDAIRARGYGDEFLRMWEFYLCYCEGGFAERFLGVGQFVFQKPLARCEPVLNRLTARPGRNAGCA